MINGFTLLWTATKAFRQFVIGSSFEKARTKAAAFVFVALAVNTAVLAQSTTFNYTGAVQTYTVTNTGNLLVDMAGARGGGFFGGGGMYGAGGRVVCSLAVTSGQVLNIYVGGAGQTPGSQISFTSGGFNGGGGGSGYDPSCCYVGGGGGGATDIRIGGTSLSDRVIVAGGGGGAGWGGGGIAGNGGDGGGLTGGSSQCCTGGSQSFGGSGGAYSGSLGVGASVTNTNGYCGGGGGGYYGGGANSSYSGGAGGSSFTHPTLATAVTHNQAYNSGDGYVIITPSPKEGMNFDGIDDHLSASNTANTQLTSGTVEAWIRTTNAGGSWRGIVTKQLAYGLFLRDNQLAAFDWGGGMDQVTGVYPNDGNWHHVALTFNSGVTNGSKIYYDGALVLTFTMSVSSQSVALAVANGSDGSLGFQSFAGDIDEVRVWNTIKTASEIVAGMNCDVPQSSDLVVNYRFNEGISGGTNTAMTKVADYSGKGNCANIYGMALTGGVSNFITGAISTCNSINVSAAITGTTSICVGANSTLSNSVTGGTWSSSNPTVASIGSTGVVTGNVSGTATISYTTCFSTATAVVTVNALPSVSAGSGVAICTGNPTTLSASGATTYVWTPGAGLSATTGASVTASPTITTTYTVTGTTGSCSASATKTVTVNAYPTVGGITGTTSIATGGSTTLSSSTSGGSGRPQTVQLQQLVPHPVL